MRKREELEKEKHLSKYQRMARRLIGALGEERALEAVSELCFVELGKDDVESRIIGALHLNVFGLEQGSVLLQACSLLNHSCEPNCFVELIPDQEPMIRLVASQEIPAMTELTVAYVDLQLPFQERSAYLEWAFGFKCQCPRCRRES
jgi:hypothetical protein